MFAPEPQRQRSGVGEVVGLFPVAELRPRLAIAPGQHERAFFGQPLERDADLIGRVLVATNRERDVPQLSVVHARASWSLRAPPQRPSRTRSSRCTTSR